jgi:hypothetical protein
MKATFKLFSAGAGMENVFIMKSINCRKGGERRRNFLTSRMDDNVTVCITLHEDAQHPLQVSPASFERLTNSPCAMEDAERRKSDISVKQCNVKHELRMRR